MSFRIRWHIKTSIYAVYTFINGGNFAKIHLFVMQFLSWKKEKRMYFTILWYGNQAYAQVTSTKLHFFLFLWCNTMTALQSDQLLKFITRSETVCTSEWKYGKMIENNIGWQAVRLRTPTRTDKDRARKRPRESSALNLDRLKITRAHYQGYYQSRAMWKHLIISDAPTAMTTTTTTAAATL